MKLRRTSVLLRMLGRLMPGRGASARPAFTITVPAPLPRACARPRTLAEAAQARALHP